MPTRFQTAVVSCAASRPSTNPAVTTLGFAGGIVLKFRILIPAGHAGLTGIALGFGGNATVPTGNAAYYSGDGREVILDYEDNNPGVGWQAFMCNNDLITHAWEVDIDYVEIGVNTPTNSPTPIPASAIIAAGTTVDEGP